ncbi:MAG TPA: hypothetical protein VJ792_00500 [Candidatus Nitrosotalea sp.]|nr:hypothetical protein [Candidatus Nitrosotalea sp.]
MNQNQEDPYHCNCFAIELGYSEQLKNQLLQNGFFDPIQENHGQLYGLATNIDDVLQFHMKTMPDGQIEAEVEPQTQFMEHLNQEYSSPAHFQVKQVLDALHIPYRQLSSSVHCMLRQIKRPSKTTKVVGVIVGAIALVGLLAVLLSDR